MSDRSQGGSAQLADALGDGIGHRIDLVGLLVQQQVIVAKMRPAHVPVKVLGLQIERKDVRQDGVHGPGNVLGRVGFQVGRGGQRGLAPHHEVLLFVLNGFLLHDLRSFQGELIVIVDPAARCRNLQTHQWQ